jgi:hypothetical protein
MIDPFNDLPYEGTLSRLTRYGTMNTPSLKTARERKGKRQPRSRAVGTASGTAQDVKVYNLNDPSNVAIVPISAFARKRTTRTTRGTSASALAEAQAQRDWRNDLLRKAGNASDYD